MDLTGAGPSAEVLPDCDSDDFSDVFGCSGKVKDTVKPGSDTNMLVALGATSEEIRSLTEEINQSETANRDNNVEATHVVAITFLHEVCNAVGFELRFGNIVWEPSPVPEEPGRPVGVITYFMGRSIRTKCRFSGHCNRFCFWTNFSPAGYNTVVSQVVSWLDQGRTMNSQQHADLAEVMMAPLRIKAQNT